MFSLVICFPINFKKRQKIWKTEYQSLAINVFKMSVTENLTDISYCSTLKVIRELTAQKMPTLLMYTVKEYWQM